MFSNESLQHGFDYDRSILLDVTTGTQTILPLVNIILVHPAVLFLIHRKKTMRWDIRIGYFSTVIGLMLSDAIIFGLRVHLLSPYAGAYCDGPLCRAGRLDPALIRVLFALIVICCFPFFVFLTTRMHQMVLRGSSSRWLLSPRSQLIFFSVLFAIELLNLFGLAIASNSVKSEAIVQSPELAWIAQRGGVIYIFGDFGQPEQIKYELLILAISIVSHAPIIIAFSMHSISHLKECRKNLISNRTLRMTNQMLEVFHCQLKGAILHILAPVLAFLITIMFDTRHLLTDWAHATMRFVITMLFVTNPLQFSLVFIIKSGGCRKLFHCLKTKRFVFQSSEYPHDSAGSCASARPPSTYSLPLIECR